MLSINILEKTDSFILFELPPGKPNANQVCRAGQDSRQRVTQEAYKGNTCWYYAFNFIRSRVGKVYDGEFKNARDIERICSQRRKAQTAHQDALPAIADQLNTELGIKFLGDINLDKAKFIIANKATLQPLMETPETLESCPSLFPFIEEFVKENKHNNMHEFLLEKKIRKME